MKGRRVGLWKFIIIGIVGFTLAVVATLAVYLGWIGDSAVINIEILITSIALAITAIALGIKTIIHGSEDDLKTFAIGLAMALLCAAIIPINIIQIAMVANNDQSYNECITKYREWDALMRQKGGQLTGSNIVVHNITQDQIEEACRNDSDRKDVTEALDSAIEKLKE
jgi:hypothetical protein